MVRWGVVRWGVVRLGVVRWDEYNGRVRRVRMSGCMECGCIPLVGSTALCC